LAHGGGVSCDPQNVEKEEHRDKAHNEDPVQGREKLDPIWRLLKIFPHVHRPVARIQRQARRKREAARRAVPVMML
jgi:hypothetical protein